jgi:hypothetical protein
MAEDYKTSQSKKTGLQRRRMTIPKSGCIDLLY